MSGNVASSVRLRSRVICLVILPILLLISTTPVSAQFFKNKTVGLKDYNFKSPVFLENPDKPEIVIIPEEQGWLVSVYGPILHHWRTGQQLTDILAIPEYDHRETIEFKLFTQDRKIESLVTIKRLHKFTRSIRNDVRFIQTADTATETAISIIRTYTKKTPDVLVAYLDQPVLFLQASVLAAHLQIPIIPLDRRFNETKINQFFKQSSVKRVFAVTQKPSAVESKLKNVVLVPLSHTEIPKLLVEKLGRENIRNILVTSFGDREFRESRPTDDAVFFVPFISLLRGAPLVISPNNIGEAVEKSLETFITEQKLQLRTITIIGDYQRVETMRLPKALKETVFESDLELEPGSMPQNGKALAYGVGRVPFPYISSMSLYYTRLQRQHARYLKRNRDFVMIANLQASEGATLHFAETVSRATAAELKNFSLNGREFYKDHPENMDIWQSVSESGLVVYEGHIDQFLAFDDGIETELGQERVIFDPLYFKEYPFVVLQSCNSLDELEPMARKGVIGVLGSSTRIHSASGSTFIKAYLDSVLYDGLTVGEALRDTKNYFISIVELKKRRDHKEQNKTNRVGLTFRLWGDPEVELFPAKNLQPKRLPIQVISQSKSEIKIETPSSFFKRVITPKYTLKMFPNAKQAGIVKSSKNSEEDKRRIESFYFFRLPYHNKSQEIKQISLGGAGSQKNRTILLEDPLKRWFYVLYYPNDEKPNQILSFEIK